MNYLLLCWLSYTPTYWPKYHFYACLCAHMCKLQEMRRHSKKKTVAVAVLLVIGGLYFVDHSDFLLVVSTHWTALMLAERAVSPLNERNHRANLIIKIRHHLSIITYSIESHPASQQKFSCVSFAGPEKVTRTSSNWVKMESRKAD